MSRLIWLGSGERNLNVGGCEAGRGRTMRITSVSSIDSSTCFTLSSFAFFFWTIIIIRDF